MVKVSAAVISPRGFLSAVQHRALFMPARSRDASPGKDLLASVIAPLAVMVVVCLLPKSPHYANAVRFVFTVVFFLAAMWLSWALASPMEHYLENRRAILYGDAGAAISMTVTKLHTRYAAHGRFMSNMATAIIAAIGLDVLSAWPALSIIAPLQPVFHWGWIGGCALLAFVLFKSRPYLLEIVDLQRQLRDQVATSGFKTRARRQIEAGQSGPSGNGSALAITGSGRFRAGEIDWKISDFYQNLLIFGKPGSGKTICVLNTMLDGVLTSTADTSLPPAGLILDPKGDYKDKIRKIMSRIGREEDLIVFGPDNADSVLWNPFDTTEDALEVANRFGAVFDLLGRGSDDAYFISQGKLFIQSCLTLIRLTKGLDAPVVEGEERKRPVPAARDFINLKNDKELLQKTLLQATQLYDLTEDERTWWEAACSYLGGTWMNLGDDTFGAVESTITAALAPFINPPFDKLMGSRSTLSVGDLIDSGKVLYVDFPVAERETMARITCTLLKAEFHRHILRRQKKARPSFFFCDEFQSFFSTDPQTSDAGFFERSRGSNHVNIVATQNYPALLKGRTETSAADNFIGNCGNLIFLRNVDERTNEWASKTLSDRLETHVGTSMAQGTTTSGNSSYAAKVRPGDFLNLRQVEEDVLNYSEAYVLVSSRSEIILEKSRWFVHPL